jgi:hypothetical protein
MGVGAHEKTGGQIYRIARWVLGVAAVVYVAWRVMQDWPALVALDVRWPGLMLSVPALVAAFWGQVRAWQWNLDSMGARVSYLPLFRTYYITNMARYIPGKVWSLAGMVAGGVQLGVAPEIMSASVLLGLVSSLVSGLCVGTMTAVVIGKSALFSWWLLLVPVGALTAVAPPVFRIWAFWVLRMFGRHDVAPYFSQRVLWRSIGHYALVWCGYGAAIGAMAVSFDSNAFWLYFALFPIAYLVGYAALFAPGGWGVREGAMVALAGGGPVALAVSLLQRIVLTFFELALFTFALWSWRND